MKSVIGVDSNGICYSHAIGSSSIQCFDARMELLGQMQTHNDVSVDTSNLHVSFSLTCSPSIDFNVKQVISSPSGHYLILIGSQLKEDKAAAAIVDVYGGHFTTSSTTTSGKSHDPPKTKECVLHHIEPQLYESRPGLDIIKAAWHPHSEGHLAILTSDSRFRLYSLSDPTLSEQSFDLSSCLSSPSVPSSSPLKSQVKFGLIRAGEGKISANSIVSFAFGPSVSWGYFSIFFLTSNGRIYHLSPVCPFGCRVPSSVLQDAFLAGEKMEASSLLTSWLTLAFPSPLTDTFNHLDHVVSRFKSKSKWTAAGYVHEASTPFLCGPINDDLVDESDVATSLLCSHHIDYSIDLSSHSSQETGTRGASTTTCIVTAFSSGRLQVRASHGLILPLWLDHSSSEKPSGCIGGSQRPQCITDARGAVLAVKYSCPLVPFTASTDEILPCGSALLVDEVDLQLSSSKVLKDEDDDEEEDDSLDLVGCDGHPQSLWVVHRTGCWLLDVPWLPTLAHALSLASKGLSKNLQAALDTLPPPSIKELITPHSELSSPSSLNQNVGCSSACSLNDLFLGDLILLLQRSDGTMKGAGSEKITCFLRQSKQSDQGTDQARHAVPKSKKAEAAAETVDARKMLLESNLSAVYSGILSQPSVSLPPPTSAVEDPEKVSYLTQCISHLQSHHVEFAHRCDQGLKQRISQLNEEARSHSSSSSELAALLSSVSNKQAEMQQRVARALELQENLIERTTILAQLHWSLPRPLSDEEKALSLELDVAEAKQATMVSSWKSLSKGLQVALEARKKEAQKDLQSGFRSVRRHGDQDSIHLPGSQAVKVYALVHDQLVQISRAANELRAMEQDIEAFKKLS